MFIFFSLLVIENPQNTSFSIFWIKKKIGEFFPLKKKDACYVSQISQMEDIQLENKYL
jgi:hypothetical protein